MRHECASEMLCIVSQKTQNESNTKIEMKNSTVKIQGTERLSKWFHVLISPG